MSRKSRFRDMRETKDRRMKRIAIGGVVVLAAVLAFEIPHLAKRGGAGSTPPAATTSTTPSATPTTTPSGTAAAATPTPTGAPTVLPNSDVAPSRSKSQLFSFTHFQGKDPFVQQVNDNTGLPAGATGSTSSDSTSSAPSGATPYTAPTAQTTAARTLATSGTARISINGRVEMVRVGKSFPSVNPLFRLVSISHGLVRIGIANGSYSSGAQTVTLAAGRSLTLVDTADGIRYTLRLLAAS
jgi:hypothetical protein